MMKKTEKANQDQEEQKLEKLRSHKAYIMGACAALTGERNNNSGKDERNNN